MNVFDGTQSHSTAAPPIPSESTTVTDATSGPRAAATSAASYPPGPPPRITMRVATALTTTPGRRTQSQQSPSLGGLIGGDNVHRGFLGRRSTAVNADVVSAVIAAWIGRVDAERDEPTCA